ncbi:MAG: hypothetical protein JWQ19_3717 [Subtercola sp.]|nr:hypothetical protein [Subtercola sp.]
MPTEPRDDAKTADSKPNRSSQQREEASPPVASAEEGLWFSHSPNPIDVQIFKINRRPIRSATLSTFEPPEDVIEHFKAALAGSLTATSGRRFRRQWRIGNLQFDPDGSYSTGRIGWTRLDKELADTWDEETKSFREHLVDVESSAVAPFAFLRAGELLGVLRHPSFTTDETINRVFEQLLNKGELSLESPSASWHVDPVGDHEEFQAWLDEMEQVLSITLRIERPNPDGADEFEAIERRLDALDAQYISETVKALDETVGLNKAGLSSDTTIRGLIGAAMRSYGFVTARGRKNGRQRKYDQRKEQLRKPIDNVGADWDTATDNVLKAVRSAGRPSE